MNRPEKTPPSTPTPPSAAPLTPYTPPQVRDQGAWQTVTLGGSVPFNGMYGLKDVGNRDA